MGKDLEKLLAAVVAFRLTGGAREWWYAIDREKYRLYTHTEWSVLRYEKDYSVTKIVDEVHARLIKEMHHADHDNLPHP